MPSTAGRLATWNLTSRQVVIAVLAMIGIGLVFAIAYAGLLALSRRQP